MRKHCRPLSACACSVGNEAEKLVPWPWWFNLLCLFLEPLGKSLCNAQT